MEKDIKQYYINIMEKLGLTPEMGYMDNYTYYKGPAPCHGGDAPAGFSFKYDFGIWACWTHGCHKKFGNDLCGLICAVKKCSKLEVDKILKDLTNGESPPPVQKLARIDKIDYYEQHINQPTFSEDYRKDLILDPTYCLNRGFTKEIFEQYGMGIGQHYKLKNRLVIPIRNIQKKIVGFTARTTENTLPKWIHSPSSKDNHDGTVSAGFKKSINLFNIDRVAKVLTETFVTDRTIILTEGPFDVLKMEMAGLTNSVAIMGSDMSQAQMKLLKKLNVPNVVVAMDNDKAGHEATKKIAQKLCRELFTVYTIIPDGGKDWGDLNKDNILKAYNNRSKHTC